MRLSTVFYLISVVFAFIACIAFNSSHSEGLAAGVEALCASLVFIGLWRFWSLRE